MTQAFAAIEDGKVSINSIFTTELGAKVNWLVTFGIISYDHHSDDHIDSVFKTIAHQRDARLIQVNITEVING